MKINNKNAGKRNLLGLIMAVIMGSSCLISSTGGAFSAKADGTDAAEDNAVKIDKLEVNGSEAPLGIDDGEPVFSWQLSSDGNGKAQSAYRVVVKEGSTTVWDSGKTASENNYGVLYGGSELKSKTLYNWTVTVWDENDEECASESSTFETGLMSESDWTAQWIGAPAAPNMNFNGANWIWDRSGHSENRIPAETLCFRREIDIDTGAVESVRIAMSADDNAKLYLNGSLVLSTLTVDDAWQSAAYTTVAASSLENGKNVIAMEATNTSDGYAGLLAKIEVFNKNSTTPATTYVTDGSWKTNETAQSGWNTLSFDDSGWNTLSGNDVISYGSAPWGNGVSFSGGDGSSAPILRKIFSTGGKTVKSARAYIAGLGLYDLRINGANPYDSVLNPANTDYENRVLYDVYDVTSAIKTGDNAIAVELGNGFYNTGSYNGWGWGNAPWKSTPKLRFELDIEYADGSTQKVYSGDDWRYYGGGPTTFNGVYHGERYDARREGDFSAVSYDDSTWLSAGIQTAPKGTLEWQDIEQMRKTAFFGSQSGTEGALSVNYSSSISKYTVTVPRMITGWGRIEFRNTTPGQQIVIDYGEIISSDGNLERKDEGGIFQRDTYICKGVSGNDTEVYEPKFTYKGFRYMQVSGYTGLTADDVTCYMINTDVATTGAFGSSNELLNTLHDTMVHTLLNNYQGKPTDTPYLEKNGWLGDVNVALGTMGFDFDIARMMVKFLNDINDAQYVNGNVPQMAPVAGDFGGSNAPVWNSVYIFAVEELCDTYGMNWLVAKYYDSMKKLADLDINEMKNHGWLWNETGILGDWVAPLGEENSPYKENPPEGGNLASSAYVWKMLGTMVEYAQSLNKTEDVAAFNQARENILAAFNEKYLKNGVYDTGEWIDEFTYSRTRYRQTSNLIPLAFGMVPEDKVQTVVENLVNDIKSKNYHLDTGVIGTKYILPVLCDYGYSDIAYRILTQTTYPSWGYWLEKGATSLWEMWESTARSHDHYFLGTYDEWFFSYIGGIKDVKDGYKTFTLDPLIAGDVTNADVSVETVRGTLAVSWQYVDGNKAQYEIQIPFGSTAKLYLPTADAANVKLGGAALAVCNGVKAVDTEDGRVVVILGSGSYTFTSPLDKRDAYKGALEQAIAEADKLSEADYRAEGWAQFTAVLSSAKDVQSNSSSQTEINSASAALNEAVATLKAQYSNQNRVTLKARVSEILSSGILNLSYPNGAVTTFQKALSAASVASRNASLTEEEMGVELATFEKAIYTLLSQCKSNLAQVGGVTVTASSAVNAENDGWGIAKLTDGIKSGNNGWSSSNLTSQQHEEWVQIDLGFNYLIDKIVLYTREQSGYSAVYGMPRDFVIELSTDGETYTPVVTETDYPPMEYGAHEFTFTQHSARYVRIRGTELNQMPYDGNTYRMQLAEVEIFNTPKANTSAAEALLERYEELDKSLYTDESLTVLENAVKKAQTLLSGAPLGESEQSKVNQTVAELEAAFDVLVLKTPENPPEETPGGNPGNNPGGTPSVDNPPAEKPDGVNVGAIVGGVIGGVAVVAAVAVAVVIILKRKNKNQ